MSVSDEWILTLFLAGLLEECAPMNMGIESSGFKITCLSLSLFEKYKICSEWLENSVSNSNANCNASLSSFCLDANTAGVSSPFKPF